MSSLLFSLLLVVAVGQARGTIYWGNGESIDRMNFDGSFRSDQFFEPIAHGFGYIRGVGDTCGLAVNRTHIFWGGPTAEAIGRANLDGTDPNPNFITNANLAGASSSCGIAVRGDKIYWTSAYGIASYGIASADLDGTNLDPVFLQTTVRPCGVAVSDTHIFWGGAIIGGIGRAKLDGTEPDQDFVELESGACGVAVDDAHVFWTNTSLGTIGRADLDGGEVDQGFIETEYRPCGIALGEGQIFWSHDSTSLIGRARLEGTDVDQRYITDTRPTCSVAVDSLSFAPPPVYRSRLALGKVIHGKKKGVVFLSVEIDDETSFNVEAAGLKSHIRGGGSGSHMALGGRKWLKLWPFVERGKGRRIRQRMRRTGRARVKVKITAATYRKIPVTKEKWLTLILRKSRSAP